MAHAILASGCEEENSGWMRNKSLRPDVLHEYTAMRNDEMMIRGGFRSTTTWLVRAAAHTRDIDQL
jgi:hypothetical protein